MKIVTVVSSDYRENGYVYADETSGVCAVIDPGASLEKFEAVFAADKRLKPAVILLTHGHFDHISTVGALRALYGCRVCAHEFEATLLENPALNVSREVAKTDISVKPDLLLTDGEMVEVGRLRLKVLHTPGHSAGGASYYDAENGIVFTGDTLFFETVGRTDLPTSNAGELAEAVLNTLFELPDGVTVMPGHGQKTTIGYERVNNVAAQSLAREFFNA